LMASTQESTDICLCYLSWSNVNISGVARGRAIGQLPNNSKVIAQGLF